jgi:hypothetical protein
MHVNLKGLLVFAAFLATVWLAVDGRFGVVAPGAAFLIEFALWFGLFTGPSGTSSTGVMPGRGRK